MDDHRLVCEGHHGLGQRERERAKPRAEAADENEGLHGDGDVGDPVREKRRCGIHGVGDGRGRNVRVIRRQPDGPTPLLC